MASRWNKGGCSVCIHAKLAYGWQIGGPRVAVGCVFKFGLWMAERWSKGGCGLCIHTRLAYGWLRGEPRVALGWPEMDGPRLANLDMTNHNQP